MKPSRKAIIDGAITQRGSLGEHHEIIYQLNDLSDPQSAIKRLIPMIAKLLDKAPKNGKIGVDDGMNAVALFQEFLGIRESPLDRLANILKGFQKTLENIKKDQVYQSTRTKFGDTCNLLFVEFPDDAIGAWFIEDLVPGSTKDEKLRQINSSTQELVNGDHSVYSNGTTDISSNISDDIHELFEYGRKIQEVLESEQSGANVGKPLEYRITTLYLRSKLPGDFLRTVMKNPSLNNSGTLFFLMFSEALDLTDLVVTVNIWQEKLNTSGRNMDNVIMQEVNKKCPNSWQSNGICKVELEFGRSTGGGGGGGGAAAPMSVTPT